MDHKKSTVSKELIHYKRKARCISDSKYDFSAKNFIPRKRKRFIRHTLNAKTSQEGTSECHSSKTDLDMPGIQEEESVSNSIVLQMAFDQATTSEVEEPSVQPEIIVEQPVYQAPSNPCEFLKLDDVQTYRSLLIQENGASVCNYNFSAFVLQDFNLNRGKLICNQYLFVQRRGLQLMDTSKLVYWCSCDAEKAALISTLHFSVNQTESDFYFPNCIHIQVCKMLLTNVKDILPDDLMFDPLMPIIENSTGSMDHVFPLRDGLSVCLYQWPNDFSVVSLNTQKELVCCSCSTDKKSCQHVALVESMMSREYPSCLDKLFAQLNTPKSAARSVVSPSGVSKKRIPFKPEGQISEILRRGGIHHCVPHSEDGLKLLCFPETDKCPSCQNNWTFLIQKLPLVTEITCLDVKVEMAVCTTCNYTVPYDGGQDALVNMSTCLVSHDLLRSYLHSFLNGRFPMYAFHKVLLAKHNDSEDIRFPSCFPYYVFRAAWYHFLDLLDIDYKGGFECPLCTAEPATIICDATSLAFRRELLQSIPQVMDDTSSDNILDGCSIENRVFIPNSKCRNLLSKYAATGCDNLVLRSFSDDDMAELQQLVTVHSPSISSLLAFWNHVIPCPSKYARLLSALATASPVCAILSPTQTNLKLIDKMICGYNVRSDPALWSQLQKTIPVLFRLIVDLDTTCVPVELRPVLADVVEKAKRPFEIIKPEEEFAFSDIDDSCSFYPHLSRKRSRRRYKADLNHKHSTCSKAYRGHPSLLPGIFTAFCPHGICVGFEVMSRRESPNIPFTLFKTRFSKAPSLVIYDNACSLHTYCLLRDPNWFKQTRFLVDRFHWSNHTGCSQGYQLDSYPDMTHLNSEINEQANAGLSKLKSQLSYMNQKNFMDHCKLYLWYRNKLKLKLIQ